MRSSLIWLLSWFMGLRILERDCWSIVNKVVWINCIPFNNAGVFLFPKTFLSPERSLTTPEKIVYHLDSFGRLGNGLVVFLWYSYRLHNINSSSYSEIMGIRILLDSFSLYIVNIYSRSSCVSADFTDISRPVWTDRYYGWLQLIPLAMEWLCGFL